MAAPRPRKRPPTDREFLEALPPWPEGPVLEQVAPAPPDGFRVQLRRRNGKATTILGPTEAAALARARAWVECGGLSQ